MRHPPFRPWCCIAFVSLLTEADRYPTKSNVPVCCLFPSRQSLKLRGRQVHIYIRHPRSTPSLGLLRKSLIGSDFVSYSRTCGAEQAQDNVKRERRRRMVPRWREFHLGIYPIPPNENDPSTPFFLPHSQQLFPPQMPVVGTSTTTPSDRLSVTAIDTISGRPPHRPSVKILPFSAPPRFWDAYRMGGGRFFLSVHFSQRGRRNARTTACGLKFDFLPVVAKWRFLA